MASIRSSNNKSTELTLIALFRENRIAGWRRHRQKITGKPDFIFPKNKIAVFVDGCFWHGCPKCNIVPKSNKGYWDNKILRNKNRDSLVSKELRKGGWIVVRIWEHQLKKHAASKVASRFKKLLDK